MISYYNPQVIWSGIWAELSWVIFVFHKSLIEVTGSLGKQMEWSRVPKMMSQTCLIP